MLLAFAYNSRSRSVSASGSREQGRTSVQTDDVVRRHIQNLNVVNLAYFPTALRLDLAPQAQGICHYKTYEIRNAIGAAL